MKVCIATKYENWSCEGTGKGKFLRRLSNALKKRGVEIVTPHEKADINLAVGKNAWPPNATKNIIRLGDVHKYKKDYKKLNARKIKALRKSDGVIYQSFYSKKICDAFLGKAECPTKIIPNGADPKEFEVEPMKSPYDTNFLTSARKWDNNKRLKTIKQAFWAAELENACLWVCGDTGHKNGGVYNPEYDSEIRMLGLVDDQKLASLYKLCNAMVDITYLSAMPNSCVEALVAGCPIVCTNQGGTHELLKYRDGSGYVVRDAEYNFKPIRKFMPVLDKNKVAKYMKVCVGNKMHFTVPYLNINLIAKQYIEFFERVLG